MADSSTRVYTVDGRRYRESPGRGSRVRSPEYRRQDLPAMQRRMAEIERREAAPSTPSPAPPAQQRRASRGPVTRPGGGQTPQVLSGGKYQNIILAEFIGTLLLTVLTPIAKDSAKQGLSPYAGADIVKLASMVLLFFLLALVSSAGPGAARVAAWLGGLVLIADGLYEASNLSKDLSLFTGFLNKSANAGASQ